MCICKGTTVAIKIRIKRSKKKLINGFFIQTNKLINERQVQLQIGTIHLVENAVHRFNR